MHFTNKSSPSKSSSVLPRLPRGINMDEEECPTTTMQSATVMPVTIQAEKKSVEFSDESMAKVLVVPSRSEMSDFELDSRWYSEEEANRFLVDIVETIKADKEPLGYFLLESEYGKNHCLRGLEHLASPEILRASKEVRAGVIRAVLGDQDRQRSIKADKQDFCYNEATRAASTRLSAYSRDLALIAGESDAAFVRWEGERAATTNAAAIVAAMRRARTTTTSRATSSAGHQAILPPTPDRGALYDTLERALEVSRSTFPLPTPGQARAAWPHRSSRGRIQTYQANLRHGAGTGPPNKMT